jgi:hypothetical protein
VQARFRWQYSLRALLTVTMLASIVMTWAGLELRKVEKRQQAYEQLKWDVYTSGGRSGFPWQTGWLHELCGQDEPYDWDFLVLNNFATVNDDTLAAIAHFENLQQLWLNGEISMTDAGLEHLKGLKRLRDLSLADASVSVAAVEDLRRALPGCEITWEPPTPSQPGSIGTGHSRH